MNEPTLILDEGGMPILEQCEGVTMPANYSFSCINNYVHCESPEYEDLQNLALSMSSHIEALRKENEELRSRISKNVPLLVNETLEYEIEDSRQENAQLRELLCLRSALPTHMPYMDDGELQDNSEFPCIDYKRDSVAEIISKLQQRTLNALKGGAA